MCIIDEDYTLDEHVKKFVEGKIDPFGSWGDNVGGWFGARNNSNEFLLLRYEDMIKNPFFELEKIAKFICFTVSEEAMRKTVEISSFKNMKSLEETESGKWKPIKYSRQDKPFIRAGSSGEWRTKMSKQSIKMIEQTWGIIMGKLGYVLSGV